MKRIFPLAVILTVLPVAGVSASEPPASAAGRVANAKTGEPVPYANVGIGELRIGTVSDESGAFRLASAGDTVEVTFSAPGFASRTLPYRSLLGGVAVELTPIVYRAEESIRVEATVDSAKPMLLGKRYPFRGHGMGFASAQLGAEVGRRIRIRKPTLIASAGFVVSHTRADGFLFRVNLRDFANGRVGAPLLQRSVIVAAPDEKGTLTVDLSEHLIVARGDVLLTLEWVKGDGDNEVPPLMFRSRRGGTEPVYQRLFSQGDFTRIDAMSLGFHLVGYALE